LDFSHPLPLAFLNRALEELPWVILIPIIGMNSPV
jgi:hypothetical protein